MSPELGQKVTNRKSLPMKMRGDLREILNFQPCEAELSNINLIQKRFLQRAQVTYLKRQSNLLKIQSFEI